jgi:hypothetical protein
MRDFQGPEELKGKSQDRDSSKIHMTSSVCHCTGSIWESVSFLAVQEFLYLLESRTYLEPLSSSIHMHTLFTRH